MQSNFKHTLLKVFSMFSVVRGYNIGLIILAQYLTSVFILAPNTPIFDVLLDPFLLAVVLATIGAVASGYIINNFYDQEKDIINNPEEFYNSIITKSFFEKEKVIIIDRSSDKIVPIINEIFLKDIKKYYLGL